MKFTKNNIYTAVNADKLKKGDKVVVADDLRNLEIKFKANRINEIKEINTDECACRFTIIDNLGREKYYTLAYLIEKADKPKKEKPKPVYRPFKNVEEFFETWHNLYGKAIPKLPDIPDIWVIINVCPKTFIKINGIDFSKNPNINCLKVGDCWINFDTLLTHYSFYREGHLIPCGVLEK